MPNFSEIPWIAEHIELYRTDPEKAHMWDSSHLGGPGVLPTLLLTTTGRKSGEPRALPLIYGEADGAYVIVEVLQDGWHQTYPITSVLDVPLDTGAERLGRFGHAVIVVDEAPLTDVKVILSLTLM